MSEPGPESKPTSHDPRSNRPLKRRALTPGSQQSNAVDALFANPDREIRIPDGDQARGLAPPPEIVANVQGSSAGAGSGEFHVYKASRRREYERLAVMDEEVRRERDAEEFEKDREDKKVKEDKRAGKNKARRDKAKARKANKGKEEGNDEDKTNGAAKNKEKPKLGRMPSAEQDDEAEAETGAAANPEEIGLVVHDDD